MKHMKEVLAGLEGCRNLYLYCEKHDDHTICILAFYERRQTHPIGILAVTFDTDEVLYWNHNADSRAEFARQLKHKIVWMPEDAPLRGILKAIHFATIAQAQELADISEKLKRISGEATAISNRTGL
jgi:hypothetical protein